MPLTEAGGGLPRPAAKAIPRSLMASFRTMLVWLACATCACAAELTPTEVIAKAHAICEEFAVEKDPMRWGDLNRAFHGTLLAASGLPFHVSTLDSAMDRLDRYLRAQLLLTDGQNRANGEHRAILAACARGDADGAAELAVAHVRGANAALRVHLARIKAGFGQS